MRREPKDDTGLQDAEFQNAIEDLARKADSKFDVLREKEVDLYVMGPVNMVDPEKEKERKKLWRRWSGGVISYSPGTGNNVRPRRDRRKRSPGQRDTLEHRGRAS